MSLEKALKRPANYNKLSERQQWEIDKNLGILDWSPTKDEIERYRKLKKEKGKEIF